MKKKVNIAKSKSGTAKSKADTSKNNNKRHWGIRVIRIILFSMLGVIALVLVAGAASFFYFKYNKPEHLSVAPVRSANSTVPFKIKKSYISIPIEINVTKLEEEMKKQIPPSTNIYEEVRTRAGIILVGCRLTTKDSGLTGNNDALSFDMRVDFNCDMKLKAAQSIATRVRGDVNVKADVKAKINSDWSVEPDIKISHKWNGDPTFTLFNQKIKFPKKTADSMAKGLIEVADDAIKESTSGGIKFKDKVSKFWDDIQKPTKVNEDPPVWLWAVPEKMFLPPLQISDNIIKVNPAILFKNIVALGEEPRVRKAPLPDLTTTKPKSDSISLAVPLIIGYDAIRSSIRDTVVNQEIDVEGSLIYRSLQINDIDIYPSDDNLVIALDTTAKGVIPLFDFNGNIYISSKIYYDRENKIIKIYDISYREALGNVLLSYFVWATHQPLKRYLNQGFEHNLAEQEADALKQINQQMSITTEDGISVKGRVRKVDFGQIVLRENNLFFYIYAEGAVKVSVQ